MAQGHQQSKEVDAEKKMYESTIPYCLNRYHFETIDVIYRTS